MLIKRMSWPVAAERVLQGADEPMTAVDIARVAIENGWVAQRSEWPSYSLQGAIAKHVKAGNVLGFKVYPGAHMHGARFWLLSKGSPSPVH
jgi:hypothetical protein